MIGELIIPTRDPIQAYRLQRWFIAASASVMVALLLFAAYKFHVLPWHAFRNAGLAILCCVVAFYAVFRSGINRLFPDQSLTFPQIFCSTLVILYVLHQAPSAHGVLALIYMVAFLFGVFRLSTTQLLALTAFVSISYAFIISLEWDAVSVENNRKVLNWIVLTATLAFFSVMGGYISRLRKSVEDSRNELEKALARIENLALHDELTGALNRRSLMDALKKQKSRADRLGTPFSILMLDIDYFKRVNDTHGHMGGDVVLKSFARAVPACLRQTDTFGRFGGEEFLVILEGTPLDQVPLVATRICECARDLNFDELASGFRISVSVGAAEYRKPETWEATLERSDRALYRAKRGGRDRFELEG
jgi:diguanylate cyclase (GGDEF)-like protein